MDNSWNRYNCIIFCIGIGNPVDSSAETGFRLRAESDIGMASGFGNDIACSFLVIQYISLRDPLFHLAGIGAYFLCVYREGDIVMACHGSLLDSEFPKYALDGDDNNRLLHHIVSVSAYKSHDDPHL